MRIAAYFGVWKNAAYCTFRLEVGRAGSTKGAKMDVSLTCS